MASRFAFQKFLLFVLLIAYIQIKINILYDPILVTHGIAYLFSFLVCIVATYFGVKWLQGIMQSGNLVFFSYYCFVLGTGSILYSVIV